MKKLLVALVLLLMACTTYSHKDWRVKPIKVDLNERTFWEVCVTDAGGIDLPSDLPPHTPKCDNWTYIKYDLPVTVSLDSNNVLHRGTVRQAVLQWNIWMEWPGFMKFVGDAEGADIQVRYSDGDNGTWGWANPSWWGRWYCEANVHHSGTEIGPVSLHEMGHCLGLAHDGTAWDEGYVVHNSVMKQGRKSIEYKLTDTDKVALWGLYDAP